MEKFVHAHIMKHYDQIYENAIVDWLGKHHCCHIRSMLYLYIAMLEETREDIAVCWQMGRVLKHPVTSGNAVQDTTPRQWEIVRDAQRQLRFDAATTMGSHVIEIVPIS
jgi:hypothetical protein